MRYGLVADNNKPIDEIVTEVKGMKADGFAVAAFSQIFGYDALTLLAVVGREVPGIELLTAVVPTYPRHPIMLAGQALTVQAATDGSLTLGIGLSHQVVIEGMFGYSFEKPARHMKEYLAILLPLLRGERVAYQGETLKGMTMGPLEIQAPAPQVLLAALAPQMLKLAAAQADGTTTWMTGPQTVADHIVPTMAKAAADAGRPTPRTCVSLPVCITDDVAAAKETAARAFAVYGTLPSYKAMLDKEGAGGPADVAIVGTEAQVRAGIAAVEAAGATEFVAVPFGNEGQVAETRALLKDLASA